MLLLLNMMLNSLIPCALLPNSRRCLIFALLYVRRFLIFVLMPLNMIHPAPGLSFSIEIEQVLFLLALALRFASCTLHLLFLALHSLLECIALFLCVLRLFSCDSKLPHVCVCV